MKQTPAETIVRFLSFAIDQCDEPLNAIERFSPRQWERVLQWLDDAGLAFYFFQKLKDAKASDAIPQSVLSRLQHNLDANQLRVEEMSHRFDRINKKFNDAGIRYAAVKGFSLVPEFCPHAPLRYQADFDYLVDENSLPAACRVLVEAGYISRDSRSSMERIYVIPGGRPSRGAEQYSPRTPHAVELHTDMWDGDMHQLPQIPNLFFLDRAISKRWNGLTFPALCDEDAFLLQVLHACHHLFASWIRMSCLFEIGHFLNQRANDSESWKQIEQSVGDSPTLCEFVVIVTELVSRLFASPVPPLIHAWASKIRPPSRVWIEHYGRRCVFSELPGYQFSLFSTSKFVLFLHQQFRLDTPAGTSVVRQRPFPSSRLSRIAASLKKDPSLALKASWWGHLVRRRLFHLLGGLLYVCEIPRWHWRNRNGIRMAS